jgi:hypothetical protein
MTIRKYCLLLMFLNVTITRVYAQAVPISTEETQLISNVIHLYSQARESRDTALLKKILMEDVDQLVSTGEWRTGTSSAIAGMLKSSAATAGTRSLNINKLRKLTATTALVDCKYDIQQKDGTIRNMWSSFVIINDQGRWKISAIRNMLPALN